MSSRSDRQADGPASGAAKGRRPDLRDWGNPLGYLAQAHAHARMICALIDVLAGAATLDKEAIAEVLDYMETDVLAHMQADGELFFPLLTARCTEDDNIGPVIGNVAEEQGLVLARLPQAAALLRAHLAEGRPLAPPEQALLHGIAAHARRHVAIENAILLPIARARLTKADLATLRAGMLAASARPDPQPQPGGRHAQ